MSGFFPEEFVAEIRERTDIVQVIEQYLQLKRSGVNFKGICPFHEEKTPSFMVNSQRQFFYCFGCHESGDVITFLMKMDGRRFNEVVEELAHRAGLELPQHKLSSTQAKVLAEKKSELQLGLDLNRQVATLYRRYLLDDKGSSARQYLQQRGISMEIAEQFHLGFAPPTGSYVTRFLERTQASLDLGQRLGLIAKRNTGSGYHDRFWNRLMFPVLNAKGDVLGFGGRMLADGEGPKYINTPDTPLYHKGKILYGLSVAALAMRKTSQAIIVEGNIDVLQMHQYGFNNTVAPMGTAFTIEQVQLLRRFASSVVAIFDGDSAGRAAARKAVSILIEGGVDAKIASLPEGYDPDTYLKERGSEAMATLLNNALPAVDFLALELQKQHDASIPGKAKIIEEIAPIVAKLPSRVTRELYVNRLSLLLGVDIKIINRALLHGAQPKLNESLKKNEQGEQAKNTHLPQIELDLLAILFDHPHLFSRVEAAGVSSLLTNADLQVTYQNAVLMQQSAGRIDSAQLLTMVPKEMRDAIVKGVLSGKFASDGDPTRALDDCLGALRRHRLKHERQDIRNQIAKARAQGDTETVRLLALRLIEVEREVHETR